MGGVVAAARLVTNAAVAESRIQRVALLYRLVYALVRDGLIGDKTRMVHGDVFRHSFLRTKLAQRHRLARLGFQA